MDEVTQPTHPCDPTLYCHFYSEAGSDGCVRSVRRCRSRCEWCLAYAIASRCTSLESGQPDRRTTLWCKRSNALPSARAANANSVPRFAKLRSSGRLWRSLRSEALRLQVGSTPQRGEGAERTKRTGQQGESRQPASDVQLRGVELETPLFGRGQFRRGCIWGRARNSWFALRRSRCVDSCWTAGAPAANCMHTASQPKTAPTILAHAPLPR